MSREYSPEMSERALQMLAEAHHRACHDDGGDSACGWVVGNEFRDIEALAAALMANSPETQAEGKSKTGLANMAKGIGGLESQPDRSRPPAQLLY